MAKTKFWLAVVEMKVSRCHFFFLNVALYSPTSIHYIHFTVNVKVHYLIVCPDHKPRPEK